MQPIPTPELLDPDRILANDRDDLIADDRTRTDLLEAALHESCAYAQQLWNCLDATRQYLIESLPSDPRAPGSRPHAGAAPTGPDDEQGWQNWIASFAAVNSVLCGPQGDSGYGLGEARRAAEERRTAPILNLHAEHPNLGTGVQADPPGRSGAGSPEPQSRAATDQPPAAHSSHGHSSKGHGFARPAVTAVLLLLAARGLRPRRSRTI